jgi:hypothetical protein
MKLPERMPTSDSTSDYYDILGANERTPAPELERLYKRMAAVRHPDKGGSEEEMKSLNEAYTVLRNRETRLAYDERRRKRPTAFIPVATPTAKDVGLLGQGLSAFFCLLVGLFLLLLVRFQWIWFLWPLAILAVLVIILGIAMARGAVRALADSLPVTTHLRAYRRVQETLFWCAVVAGCYGVYLLLTTV